MGYDATSLQLGGGCTVLPGSQAESLWAKTLIMLSLIPKSRVMMIAFLSHVQEETLTNMDWDSRHQPLCFEVESTSRPWTNFRVLQCYP